MKLRNPFKRRPKPPVADATVTSFAYFAALVRLNTDAAREWFELNVSPERITWGGGVVVEWPYLDALIAGMRDVGLVVEGR